MKKSQQFNDAQTLEAATLPATSGDLVRIPGLRRKDNVFQLRRRVPADLRAHYGKAEITISLKTEDSRVATIRGAEEYARLEAEFARLRKGPSFRKQ